MGSTAIKSRYHPNQVRRQTTVIFYGKYSNKMVKQKLANQKQRLKAFAIARMNSRELYIANDFVL